jgi:hypothetical protein
MAEYLEESKKNVMRKFMWKNFVYINVDTDETLGPSEFRFFSRKNGAELKLEE